jgi:tritrans,polycis-undecaprenyl-diphosphate synthase [geranylgeranyl-diphosphate specific]
MLHRLRDLAARAYRQHLRREIESVPTHVAVIQDGNRRYARERGDDAPQGHRAGADTTERVLDWCADLGVAELTLYAFSTENFERPDEELRPLFDLLEGKLREFADADRVHDQGVRVRAIGDVDRLPERVRDAVDYAERRTADNDQFTLNIALAYGGRTELLDAARGIARDVAAGDLDPEAVDVETVEDRLYDQPLRDVDLIVRAGGDERTSNFLPWHANGNEAAVYFCAPYWPEFSEAEFLRAIRTYQAREASWQRARAERAVALVRAVAEVELAESHAVAARLRDRVPRLDGDLLDAALPGGAGGADDQRDSGDSVDQNDGRDGSADAGAGRDEPADAGAPDDSGDSNNERNESASAERESKLAD